MTAFLQINGTSLITHLHSETSNHHSRRLIKNKGYNIASAYLRNEYFRIINRQKNCKLPPLNVLMHRLLLNPYDLIDSKKSLNHHASLNESDSTTQKRHATSFKQYLTIVNSFPNAHQPSLDFTNSLPKLSEHEIVGTNETKDAIIDLSHSVDSVYKLPVIIPPMWPKTLRKKVRIINALKRKENEKFLPPIQTRNHTSEAFTEVKKNSFSISKNNGDNKSYQNGNENKIEKEKYSLKQNIINNSEINKEHKNKNDFKTIRNEQIKTKNDNAKNKDDFLSEYYRLIKNRKLILIDESMEKYTNTDFKYLSE